MSYWQNYRALKEKGLVSAPVVEDSGPGTPEVIVQSKAQFNQWGERLPADYRETLTIAEVLAARARLKDEIADMDAWLQDSITARDVYRVARKAQIEEDARIEAEALAAEVAAKKAQVEEDARLQAEADAAQLEELETQREQEREKSNEVTVIPAP